MNRLNLCLVLALSASFAHAQKPIPPDDGGLRTLPGLPDDAADQPPGPRRVTRIESLLLKGDFARLDQTADRLRSEKTREPGGGWFLKTFYSELNPHETDEQALAVRRQQFEAWIKQNPKSVTARIALAEFYTRYAWLARGTATEDKVADSAWPLFKARAKQAEDVLHDALKLDQKCPEWYSALQTVALAEDWANDRAKSLYEQAIQFEPDYPYYYNSYANYLLPKWDGSEKASLDFIQQASDRRGGEQGDILYFEIATVLITKHNGQFRPQLDWQRIQRGHTALEAAYGPTRAEQNHFALMAVRNRDAATAQKEFTEIGERWSKTVWRTRAEFDQARIWAASKARI